MLPDLSRHFPRYEDYEPLAPVYCVTPDKGGAFHRFFDTSPISPSGRYLAVTRIAHEHRLPEPGEPAEVVLVDLEAGTERVVAETHGWDAQLGAQAQWGKDDSELFFNDMDTATWQPFGVRMNPLKGERKTLPGTVYMVSPDGRWAASPCLLRTGCTQPGYGVVAPEEAVPKNHGAPEDDGLYLTDTESGHFRLTASFRAIADACPPEFSDEELAATDLYGFHVKWNPQGTRLMMVVRGVPRDGDGRMRPRLVTMKPDGSDIHVAVPAETWRAGRGNHPNWCPDGERVLMNLALDGDTMQFATVRYDGAGLRALDGVTSSRGHPSLHPTRPYMLTDTYLYEPKAFGDGTVPILLTDLAAKREQVLVRIRVKPKLDVPDYASPYDVMRIDAHPAWDHSFQRVTFNGCPDGTRRVYVADLQELLAAAD